MHHSSLTSKGSRNFRLRTVPVCNNNISPYLGGMHMVLQSCSSICSKWPWLHLTGRQPSRYLPSSCRSACLTQGPVVQRSLLCKTEDGTHRVATCKAGSHLGTRNFSCHCFVALSPCLRCPRACCRWIPAASFPLRPPPLPSAHCKRWHQRDRPAETHCIRSISC